MTRLNELMRPKSKQRAAGWQHFFSVAGSAQGNPSIYTLSLSRTNIIKILYELLRHNKIRTHAARPTKIQFRSGGLTIHTMWQRKNSTCRMQY
jgi:hypothetical protein